MLGEQEQNLREQFAYAIYSDTRYTQASPLVLANGTRTRLSINGQGTTTQNVIPAGEPAWWDAANHKLVCAYAGDTYLIRTNCTVDIGVGITLDLTHQLDIPNYTGPGTASRIASTDIATVSGLTTYTTRELSFLNTIVGTAPFKAGGAELYLRADKVLGTLLNALSTVKVYNLSIAIFRQRKGA